MNLKTMLEEQQKQLELLLVKKQKTHDEIGGQCELTYHGGRAIGYLEGRISAIDDILFILKEEKL